MGIFTPTIFSLRAGIRSRACGYFIAFIEFIVVLLPFTVTSYLPNYFFGALLIFICVDLMHEWLWNVKNKSTKPEYCIALSTFLLIQFFGVEYGILLGLVLFFVAYKMDYDVGIVDDTYLKETEEQVLLPLKNSINSLLSSFGSKSSNSMASPASSITAEECQRLLRSKPLNNSTTSLHDESLII